jgi:hypothetical protein
MSTEAQINANQQNSLHKNRPGRERLRVDTNKKAKIKMQNYNLKIKNSDNRPFRAKKAEK